MPVIERLSSAFTDTSLPKLYRDKSLNKGSLLLFDPGDPYCRNGVAAGALTTSAIFKNLVDGGADFTITQSGNAASLNAGAGGVTFPGVAANGMQISAGPGYDLSTLDHDFLALLWVKIPAVPTGSASANMFALSAAAQNGMFYIHNGGLMNNPGGVANQQSNSPAPVSFPGWTTDTVHQLGVGFRITGGVARGLIFLDGALVNSVVTNADIVSQGGANLLIGNPRAKSTIYRAYLEDTTVSGLTMEDQVAADWNFNRLRFA